MHYLSCLGTFWRQNQIKTRSTLGTRQCVNPNSWIYAPQVWKICWKVYLSLELSWFIEKGIKKSNLNMDCKMLMDCWCWKYIWKWIKISLSSKKIKKRKRKTKHINDIHKSEWKKCEWFFLPKSIHMLSYSASLIEYNSSEPISRYPDKDGQY